MIVGSAIGTTGGGVDLEVFGGVSVAVASRLAELIDHGFLVENIFVNCNISSEESAAIPTGRSGPRKCP